MVDFLVSRLIMPHLLAFTYYYPGINIHIDASYNVMSLDNREADVVLRFGSISPEFKPNFDLWVLTHSDLRTMARFSVLSDFLCASIKGQRQLLEGNIPKLA